MKDYKNCCADCPALIEKDGKWFCDEEQAPCEDVEECPEGIHQCTWCEEWFSDCVKEINLGYLCPRCVDAIRSRGEKLTIEDQ